VNFDGSGSSDPDPGDTISYSWDLNGDGTFGDSTAQKPSYTYATAGTYNAVLKVTDNKGASTNSSPITITVSSGTGSTFGTTTPGSSVDTASANFKEVSKFTAPLAGSIKKVTGYISGLGAASGSQKIRAVLYADSGGNPGTLLGVSNEVTINAGRAWGWVDFNFSSPVAIQAGTIWIGYIAGTTSDLTQLRYGPLANDGRYNTNSYSSGASNPFGSATTISFHYSIYATYN
jgi:PKD repeat protein